MEKLKVGNEALKQLHKELDINKVEKIMDDTAEGRHLCTCITSYMIGIAYQNEIQDLISSELTPEDEQDIMQELDKLLEKEVL